MNEDRILILGNRLKLIRAEAKLKQKEFAEQFGVAPTTYSGYESGKHEPTLNFLIAVADKYKLSLDYVVGRSVNKGGLADDEVNDFFNENLIEPFKQEGKSQVDIMEEVYQKLTNQITSAQNEMLELRKLIDDEKKKNEA